MRPSAPPRRSLLILLRVVQGLALGGEYAGAATYVAEHAPENRRGYYTSFIQLMPTIGLFASSVIVLGIRGALGEPAFTDWGWRVPFLISLVFVAISYYIRVRLEESPVFARAQGTGEDVSRAPIRESYATPERWRLFADRAVRRDGGAGGAGADDAGVRAVLPSTRVAGAGGRVVSHHGRRAAAGDAAVSAVRRAVRSHRAESR